MQKSCSWENDQRWTTSLSDQMSINGQSASNQIIDLTISFVQTYSIFKVKKSAISMSALLFLLMCFSFHFTSEVPKTEQSNHCQCNNGHLLAPRISMVVSSYGTNSWSDQPPRYHSFSPSLYKCACVQYSGARTPFLIKKALRRTGPQKHSRGQQK